jgi:exodeoxyribonuclease V beta subunit
LLFEHEGRYYILDYKSNALGGGDQDYTREVMRDAIAHARYDLQYVLYLLALHRLLSSRLQGYDYDTHVGGAIYLFLRGIQGPASGVHFEKPPKSLILALDRLFAGKPVESV